MKSQKRILTECQELAFQNWVSLDIHGVSQALASKIRGWIFYYGKFRRSEMSRIFSLINRRLAKWLKKKYKIKTFGQAYGRLKQIIKFYPNTFEHWKYGFRS